MVPPSCRELFTTPEATPTSSGDTPSVATAPISTIEPPIPTAVTADGSRIPSQKSKCAGIVANSPRPIAATTPKTTIAIRAPMRAESRCATAIPTTTKRQNGRKSTPVTALSTPHTVWM